MITHHHPLGDQEKELQALATQMKCALQKTGQPQEEMITCFDQQIKIILRYRLEQRIIQLVTVIWARQVPLPLRAELKEAFGIPLSTSPSFDYIRGYGVMRLTWRSEPPEVEQLTMFDTLPEEAGLGMYQGKWV